VHDLIDVNLAQWISVLTPSELETAILRQSVVDNKLAVSLAYGNASATPNGSFLNAHVVGDAAFQAEVRALNEVVSPFIASVQIADINQAVSSHDIGIVGILPVPWKHLPLGALGAEALCTPKSNNNGSGFSSILKVGGPDGVRGFLGPKEPHYRGQRRRKRNPSKGNARHPD
jgi:hypothetical protein